MIKERKFIMSYESLITGYIHKHWTKEEVFDKLYVAYKSYQEAEGNDNL